MKKPLVSRKKARMLLALLIFLLQALIIVGVLWWIAKNTVLQPYTDTIQLNWHVDIVGKNTCLYSKDEGTAEGIRYHVFAYEDRMEFEGLDLSESGKGVPMVSVRELLEELEVPQTEQPDLTASQGSLPFTAGSMTNATGFICWWMKTAKPFMWWSHFCK